MLAVTQLCGFGALGPRTTINPADKGASCTLSNGNLKADFANGARALARVFRPLTVRSVWECTINDNAQRGFVGVCSSAVAASGVDPTADANTYMLWTFDGTYKAGAHQDSLSALNSGAIVMVEYDPPNGTLKFFVSGSQYGTTMTGVPAGLYPVVGNQSASAVTSVICNFGQAAFSQAVPAGAQHGIYI